MERTMIVGCFDERSMMVVRFDVERAGIGWHAVYTQTGSTASADGAKAGHLDEAEASEIANLLNTLALLTQRPAIN